jgi:TM2 domain-containing membrane protein YozV
VSNLDLPLQPSPDGRPAAPAGGFRPYPVYPEEPALADRSLQDPVPGYFQPDPAAALAPFQPSSPPALAPTVRTTRRQRRRARRQLRRGQISEEAIRQAAAPLLSSPEAPYGRDPLTGQPLSDKNKVLAAFLQLFFGAIGAGRFYIGDARTGFISVGLLLAAILGTVYLGLWFLFVVLGLWTLIDFIMLISGHITDSDGRKLR